MTDRIDKILVVKLSSMGDVLHAMPAVCHLRDRYPNSRISWLVDDRFVGLVQGHVAVDDLLVARAPRWVGRLGPVEHVGRGAAHLGTAFDLASRGFDLVVDFQGLFKTGVLVASTGAGFRLGFANAREGAVLAYTRAERIPIGDHAVRRCLKLVESIAGPVAHVRFDLPVSPDARSAADEMLRRIGIPPQSPFLAVAPRSSRSEKNWPLSRFAKVVGHVWRRWSLPSIVLGGAREREACQQVARDSESPAAVLAGEPLAVVRAVLGRSRLLLGLDSGPIHLAAALGRPVVALFGPTDPARFAPWGSEHLVVRSAAPCSACRAAAVGGHLAHRLLSHRCMKDVSVGDVLAKIDAELSRELPIQAA